MTGRSLNRIFLSGFTPVLFTSAVTLCAVVSAGSACAQEGEGGSLAGFFKPFRPGKLPDIAAILQRAEKEVDARLGEGASGSASRSEVDKKQALIEKMIVIEPGREGDPPVPAGFIDQVHFGMAAYPYAILCLLMQHHYLVHVAPFVVRADPELEKMQPSNYPVGSSFLNCRAVFTQKGIMIGSHYYKKGKLLPNLNPLNGVEHEIAHAVDQALDRPSLSSQFLDLYKQERSGINLIDRVPIAYYLRGEESGPIETFAQLLANKYCHFFEHHTLTLVRCFPLCNGFIDKLFPAEQGKPAEKSGKPAQAPGKRAEAPGQP